MQAALTDALHIPLKSIVRFRCVDVTSVVAPMVTPVPPHLRQRRRLQDYRNVILAVAYRLLLPEKRHEHVTEQLAGMGQGSGLLRSFSEILEGHGVSVSDFKVVYPPSPVTQEELEQEEANATATSAPGSRAGAPSITAGTTPLVTTGPSTQRVVDGIQSPKLPASRSTDGHIETTPSPEALDQPTWSSTQKVFMVGAAAVLVALLILAICAILQMISLKARTTSHLDTSSTAHMRAPAGIGRGPSEDRRLLDSDSTSGISDSPDRQISTGRGFPPGYEPISAQDGTLRFNAGEGM